MNVERDVRLFRVVLGFVLSDVAACSAYVKLGGDYVMGLYPGFFLCTLLAWYLLSKVDRLTIVSLFIACIVLNIICFYILGSELITGSIVEDARIYMSGLLSVALSVLVFWLIAYGARYRVLKVAVSIESYEEGNSPVPSRQAVVMGVPMVSFVLSVSGVLAYLVLNYTIDWVSVVIDRGSLSIFLLAFVVSAILFIPVVISSFLFGKYTLLTPEPVSFVGKYDIIPERPLVVLFPDTKLFIEIGEDSYHNEFMAAEYEFEHNFEAYYMGSIVPLENEMSAVLYGNDAKLQLHMMDRYYSSHDKVAHLRFSVEGDIPDNEVYNRIKITNSNGVELRDVNILWGKRNAQALFYYLLMKNE